MDRAHRLRRTLAAEVGRAAGEGLAPDQVVAGLLATLDRVLDLQGACWHQTDPASGIPISSRRVGHPPGAFEQSLEFEFRRRDVAPFRALQRRSRPVAVLGLETRGEPARSQRYREMIEPAGGRDELRVAFVDAFGAWGLLTAFGGRRFTQDEADLVAGLVPTVTRALRQGRASAARTPVPAGRDEGPAVVLLDGDDRLLGADALARRRLAALGPGLPGVVHVVAAAARRPQAGWPSSARVRDADGRWLLLDASLLDGDAGGTVAVVLRPAGAAERLDELLRGCALTGRERQVAALAAGGGSSKTIAGTLGLSRWTVQDHLKRAFAKTGTHGREELAQLAGAGARPPEG